jgi:acid phosphatase
MDNDNFWQLPTNISTVADLLNTKNISWGEYQEGIPYPGFQGFNYSNQQTFANKYVRKHNPLVLFDTITSNATTLRQIKNFTDFNADLDNKQLPQWAFITPNMTNDGHDTNVTFASTWLRGFVSGLMNNTYFWDNTLLLVTFDESEHYPIQNNVFSILLGGAIPTDLIGSTDDTLYTHYSSIASVSANWGLPSLGRWDCGANLFQLVANKTGYTNYEVDTTNLLLNESLPGPLSLNEFSIFRSNWPVPATNATCSAGNGILQQVKDTYQGQQPTYNYTSPIWYDATANLGLNVSYSRNGTTYVTGVNSTSTTTSSTSSSSSSAPASSSSKAAAPLTSTNVEGGLLAVVLSTLIGLIV